MDDVQLSRYPHLSWMRFVGQISERQPAAAFKFHGITHWLSCSVRRNATVRVIHSAQQHRFECPEKTIRYSPSALQHEYVIRRGEPGHVFAVLLIPDSHLRRFCEQDGIRASGERQGWLRHNDHKFAADICRLAVAPAEREANVGAALDDVARRLVLRLAELNGSGKPDWHDDRSLFDRRTLFNLLEYLDGNLRTPPALSDMALLAGVSPSHFAKKFRQSTGLSLCRFINRRRILRSLETLKTDDSLASIALNLGFSSQSHFTRIFSGLTGMTPANYQKQARRVVG